jgi:hypothetical protein
MSDVHDQEFEVPPGKGPAGPVGAEPPASKLAIVSLIFGILGLTAIPVVGSLVAIVTGHNAMGQIRESNGHVGGRSMARAGMILGYLPFGLVIVAAALAIPIYWITSMPQADLDAGRRMRGVRMVNEMNREDYALLEQANFESLAGVGKIIAYYNAGKLKSDPEFALLTDEAIRYFKEGRWTIFHFTDVDEVKTKPFEPFGDVCEIEIHDKDGPRMRISVSPQEDGVTFFDALQSAWKAASEKPKGVSTKVDAAK